MSLPSFVYLGTAITTTVTFTNPDSPAPVDPTTITLKFYAGSGSVTEWVYGVSGSIIRQSEGVYSAELLTTSAGSWSVEWIGTGACAAVNVAPFQVDPQPF